MYVIKVANRDERDLISDYTGRGCKKINTYQSSSTPRIPVLDRPRSTHLSCHHRDLGPVSDRLRRLNVLRLELPKIGKNLSVLEIDYSPPQLQPCFWRATLHLNFLGSVLQYSGTPWFSVFDNHGGRLDYLDGLLRLESQEIEEKLSVVDTHYTSFIEELEGDLWVLFKEYMSFLKISKPQLPGIRKWYKRKKSKKQIIERPWTDFPTERKQTPQVSTDAYRPFVLICSGREHKDHIFGHTTDFDGLQAQSEPLDDWAIASPVDMNMNTARRVSKWRLWEGRSKEWRLCKVLKMLSSTSFHTTAVKGERLGSLQWGKVGVIAPITMLQRNSRFRSAHAPKKEAAKQLRRNEPSKSSWRARVIEIEGEAFCDEPIEPSAPSDEPVCSFEDIRREMPAAPPLLIPYENYIGAILGGQFQLGPLIRQDCDGDVYLVDSLNKSTPNLEAKAYTLGELVTSQRELGQRLCSIDQAGKKFVVYRVDAKSQDSRKQQQRSVLQAPDAHSSHDRPSRSTVTQLHRSSTMEAADKIQTGKIQTGKDKPKSVVARGPKQRTPNLIDGDDEAADSPQVTDIRTQRQQMHVAKQSPKLATMIAADDSQRNNVPEKKKRRKRNRGLKKAKVPRFTDLSELESFLAIMNSRLKIQRTKLSTKEPITHYSLSTENWDQYQRTHHKRMAKTTAATQRQYDILSSRFFWAQKKEEDWQTLLGKISGEVSEYVLSIEDEQLDLEEMSWTLRKNPPFGARSNKKRSKPLPQLLEYYQVFDFEDLDDLEWEHMEEIEQILNGEEGLYRRL